MKGIHLKFKKIMNWTQEQNFIKVRVKLDEQNILFDDIIEGTKTKNALKLDAILPLDDIQRQLNLQIQFYKDEVILIGSIQININRQTLRQQHCYIPITNTHLIIQLQVKDTTQQTRLKLAKDCMDILTQSQQLRQKRLDQIEKTNNFIKKRQMFLQQYISKQEPVVKKKSLNKLIKQLSSIKRQIKSLDGPSEMSQQFSDNQRGFTKRNKDNYSSQLNPKENGQQSDARSYR